VTPVEASVTGGGELVELAPLGAVAVVPQGWPTGADAQHVALEGAVALPLLALRAARPAPPAVLRLLALLGG
jgi:hypothetical protein